ncbi:discoidin domain-containing protein, partial [Streptomyces albus]|uniref:discoidin domain-containing protein n=1 Tax=Streptomyces albus TaxID=1888 RepID=UPI000AD14040
MGTTKRTARARRGAAGTRAWRPVLAAVLSTGLLLSGWQAASADTAQDGRTVGGDTGPLRVRLSGEDAARAQDGDPDTYAKGRTSHWVRADLGATRRLDRVELSLPGGAQRVQLQGSVNGRDFTELSDARPRKGEVTVRLGGAPVRYLRAAGAHRVGELAVYGAESGDTTPPGTPHRVRLDGAVLHW